MPVEADLEVVRRFYAAVAAGEHDAAGACSADDDGFWTDP